MGGEKTMKVAKIFDNIYGQVIYLTYGTLDERDRWLKKNGVTDELKTNSFWDAVTATIEVKKDGLIYQDYHVHFCSYGFSRIVHETNHLTHRVLSGVGMELCEETEEAYAYYQDWIASKIRDYMEKWTKPTKKPRRRRRVSK